ncbi:MAG: hypothetical protein ACXWE0_10835 [Nitrososphaeraceae archaeon]
MGAGIGTALMGMKPILEMMFSDFVAVCFDGILNQAAKIKFMAVSYMVSVASAAAAELKKSIILMLR